MKKISKEKLEEQIREYAYRWYELRKKYGIAGDAVSDWEKAVAMVRAEYTLENPTYV